MKTLNMASPMGLHGRYMDFTHETGRAEEGMSQALNI